MDVGDPNSSPSACMASILWLGHLAILATCFIAVKGHLDKVAHKRKCLLGVLFTVSDSGSRIIIVRSIAAGRHGAEAAAEGLHPDPPA